MSDHRAPQRASLIGRPSRRLLAVLAVLLVVGGTTLFTGAAFVSGSTTSASVNAARDYYPPKVSVTSPGATVSGTVAISAPASDTGSGVAQVVIQYAAAGSSTWTSLCTDTSSPYSCTWDTLAVADGDYQLRAIATDNVGTTATSAIVTTKVANPAAVTLTRVPDVVRGTVGLGATVTGSNGRTVTSAFQHRVDQATTWTTITGCGAVTGLTPTCSWTTTGLTSDFYDIRVVSTVGSTTQVSAEQLDVVVDNLAPTVSVAVPSPASGIVQVTATPADDDSGVASVDLSYRSTLLGITGAWTPICTTTASPWRCAWDTTKLGNGTYEVRGVATDVAGNTATSTTATTQVNNGLASVTITSPLGGDRVTGTSTTITTDYTVPVATSATSVRIEARPTSPSGSAWTTVCTDTTAPFSCDWATASLASGTWDLRATLTYTGGLTATSLLVTVTVDNNPIRAYDVQATNGGVLGRPDAGDTLVLTYAGTVDPATVRPTTATFSDKAVGPATATDRVSLGNLGTIALPQNYVRKKKSVTLNVTVSVTSGTTAGLTTTTVTVTLGGVSSGAASDLVSSATAGAMTWTPSANAKSATGVACSTTPVTESGASDRDL